MKGCFGIRSKKQQRKQKQSTLIQERQFKRSDGNSSSTKHRLKTTTINVDESIINQTTNSSYKSNIIDSSHETKPLLTRKRKLNDNDHSSR